MNETKHTQGPWTIHDGGMNMGWKIVADNEPKCRKNIASCGGQLRDGNAQLIAAAPDMLAALEAASAAMLTGDGDWSHEETEAYDIIDAAIAKAKGGAK